jgi:hypothetical protein
VKPTIADHVSLLGGSLAGRGDVLIPRHAFRTGPPERERRQRDSDPFAPTARSSGPVGQRVLQMTRPRLSTVSKAWRT